MTQNIRDLDCPSVERRAPVLPHRTFGGSSQNSATTRALVQRKQVAERSAKSSKVPESERPSDTRRSCARRKNA